MNPLTPNGNNDNPFPQAEQDWYLDRLYSDLGKIKAKERSSDKHELTDREKQILQGLLCNYSPAKIASQLCLSEGTIKTNLSIGLYRYIEILTNKQENSIEKWTFVSLWLKEAGYKRQERYQDWGQAPDLSIFYGREKELETLKEWIIQDSCRLITLSGMGGVGKTALAIKLAQEITDKFEVILWRSLAYIPHFNEFLNNLLKSLKYPNYMNLATRPLQHIK